MSRAGGCFTVNLSLVKLYISSERNVAIMASPAIVNQRFHTSAHSYSALSICAIDLRSYFALSVLHCRNYCTFGKYSLENFLQPVVKSSNFYSCRHTHFLLSDTHIFPRINGIFRRSIYFLLTFATSRNKSAGNWQVRGPYIDRTGNRTLGVQAGMQRWERRLEF